MALLGKDTLHVVVIAHPDDESMFFVPTIQHLLQNNETVWIVCLTTGDYDGLGQVRCRELQHVGTFILRVQKVIQLDEMKDHPTNEWIIGEATDSLYRALSQQIRNCPEKMLHLITFDDLGVSGHINHRDTSRAVQQLAQIIIPSVGSTKVSLLQTETNILIKYLPVMSWFLLLLSWLKLVPKSTAKLEPKTWSCRWMGPTLNWHAMAGHYSQFVWYRRLFVIFSSYTYYNRFKEVDFHEKAN